MGGREEGWRRCRGYWRGRYGGLLDADCDLHLATWRAWRVVWCGLELRRWRLGLAGSGGSSAPDVVAWCDVTLGWMDVALLLPLEHGQHGSAGHGGRHTRSRAAQFALLGNCDEVSLEVGLAPGSLDTKRCAESPGCAPLLPASVIRSHIAALLRPARVTRITHRQTRVLHNVQTAGTLSLNPTQDSTLTLFPSNAVVRGTRQAGRQHDR